MTTLITWAVITIIALIAGIMLILFLFNKKKAEDNIDAAFVCSICNDKHCTCYKEESFETDQGETNQGETDD
ncbi:Uncharacterized protein dnl_12660 [Desulfonema limicola]|uniref:Uncharacterized protein n=1 Tax=Desulfonema limicola TaxID=45656 RepID=A0A975GFC1_9BACT|nr:hypothetical protein [Desulfonema limicola]QTA79019.1 Uncharacterized protein dnl_12660 [Desulfonema limicola]